MESIIDYLKRNLREAGHRLWPAIASEVNAELVDADRVSEHLLRKIAYGDRVNPGVKSVQPLINYFQAIERGERQLPPAPEPSKEVA